MFRSLRFRLPAFFLGGVLLSGLVAVLIAFQLFESYSRSHAVSDLRREAAGVGKLYNQQGNDYVHGKPVATFAAQTLEQVTGDKTSSLGIEPFPREFDGLIHVQGAAVGIPAIPDRPSSPT